MNTNSIPAIAAVAQGAGIHLTGEQLTVVLTMGAAIVRWLALELKSGISFWAKIGGRTGLLLFFKTGSTQPKQPNPFDGMPPITKP